jgi:hypothetical protein
MAVKNKTVLKWTGDSLYLLAPLKRADGTLSTALETGSEWSLEDLPKDLAESPYMAAVDSEKAILKPTVLIDRGGV